jgi:hypothetical protein
VRAVSLRLAAFGRGGEQKVFWGGECRQGPTQNIVPALILMGDWCAVCATTIENQVREGATNKGVSRKTNAWGARRFLFAPIDGDG